MAAKDKLPDLSNVWVSSVELGAVIGISDTRVNELAVEGILNRADASRKPYKLTDSIKAYCDNQREKAAGRTSANGEFDLMSERAKKEHYQAISAEVKAAQDVGAVVSREEIETAWARIIATSKAQLMLVPAEARSRIKTLTDSDVELLEEMISDRMTHLADGGEHAITRVGGAASEA